RSDSISDQRQQVYRRDFVAGDRGALSPRKKEDDLPSIHRSPDDYVRATYQNPPSPSAKQGPSATRPSRARPRTEHPDALQRAISIGMVGSTLSHQMPETSFFPGGHDSPQRNSPSSSTLPKSATHNSPRARPPSIAQASPAQQHRFSSGFSSPSPTTPTPIDSPIQSIPSNSGNNSRHGSSG